MMRMDDFNLTGRVLSANSPAVLALRSEASRRAARRQDARSRPPACKAMLVEGQGSGSCRRAARTVLALRSEASKSRCASPGPPLGATRKKSIPPKLASFARLITVWEGEKGTGYFLANEQ